MFIKAMWSLGAVCGMRHLPLSGLDAVADAAEAPETLKKAAARIGLRYGSDSDVPFARAPKEYSTLFVEQCELYALMMWGGYLEPGRKNVDPVHEDRNVAMADQHGIKLTGGHLIWHTSTPEWVNKLESADEMRSAISNHIATVGRRYGSRLYSWNVANESLNPREGRPHGLLGMAIYDKLGIGGLDYAFRAAQAAAPGVIRVYNDYEIEMDAPDQEIKRHALLRLLDEFQKKNTPIDAVGVQSHLLKEGGKFNEEIFRRFLRDIASRGLKIFITELDVMDAGLAADVATRDREVADLYERFLSVSLDEPAVAAVVTWGLCDKYTWLSQEFKRADGQPLRPLPFDAALRPKPAYYAMLKAFQNAPPRKV
jgi:endo-1,4-beta-xylanase